MISSAAATFFSASSDRGGSADVGRRIAEELIRESDDKIIHRATYESINVQTGMCRQAKSTVPLMLTASLF